MICDFTFHIIDDDFYARIGNFYGYLRANISASLPKKKQKQPKTTMSK